MFYFQTLKKRQYFAVGAIAKAVATILTYPLQVAQCKQRVSVTMYVVWCLKAVSRGAAQVAHTR